MTNRIHAELTPGAMLSALTSIPQSTAIEHIYGATKGFGLAATPLESLLEELHAMHNPEHPHRCKDGIVWDEAAIVGILGLEDQNPNAEPEGLRLDEKEFRVLCRLRMSLGALAWDCLRLSDIPPEIQSGFMTKTTGDSLSLFGKNGHLRYGEYKSAVYRLKGWARENPSEDARPLRLDGDTSAVGQIERVCQRFGEVVTYYNEYPDVEVAIGDWCYETSVDTSVKPTLRADIFEGFVRIFG
jgi:hypothetical protein